MMGKDEGRGRGAKREFCGIKMVAAAVLRLKDLWI